MSVTPRKWRFGLVSEYGAAFDRDGPEIVHHRGSVQSG